jgi:hypothetical protein
MLVEAKIAIQKFVVDQAQANSAFSTRVSCLAGPAVNFTSCIRPENLAAQTDSPKLTAEATVNFSSYASQLAAPIVNFSSRSRC